MNSDLSAVFAAMSVRDLRKKLRERGVDAASCIEKADLVQLPVANWDVQDKPPSRPAAIASSAAEASIQQAKLSPACRAKPQPKSDEASPGAGLVLLQQGGSLQATAFVCQACGRRDDGAGGKLLRCGKCKEAHYCSKECQMAEWPAHKSQCNELRLGQQCLTDSVGMAVFTAFNAWFKRFELLIIEAAAAILWPAPPRLPRNRSHGLQLHIEYSSSKPPRFQVGAVEELTMEEMSAIANGGKGFQCPPTGRDGRRSETMEVIIAVLWRGGRTCRNMRLILTDQMASGLKDGSMKLPSAAETIARINMLS